ncbi:virulence-associated E family protein [Gammaproteobacteria bacterium]|nr:virulence-associated E family protein [Gammaproteobacteria bacterium]
MSKKKDQKTKIKRVPFLREIVPDYKRLTIDELLAKCHDNIERHDYDPLEVLNLYWQETSSRFDEWKEEGKKAEATLHVFQALCKKVEISIRYDRMTHRIEIDCPHFKNLEVMGQAEEQRYLLVKEVCRQFNFPTNLALEYIKLSCKPYHPAEDWIMSKEWDLTQRFEEFFATLNCKNENQELAKQFLWKWSLQAVRAVLGEDGKSSELVLVLHGSQHAGKTRWFRSLAPDGMVKTGLQLNPNNKDSVLEANTAWINELGELDGITRKSDHANLKAHFSKDYDYIRRPYGIVEERIPRKSVYGATVNDNSFLVDDTGNRRYLVMEVDDIDHSHDVDMQQYWREVWIQAIRNDTPHWLSKEEIESQNTLNERFRTVHPIIQNLQEMEDSLLDKEYQVKQIIVDTSDLEKAKITPHQCKLVKQYLLSNGWSERSIGKNQYVLVNPNVKGNGLIF